MHSITLQSMPIKLNPFLPLAMPKTHKSSSLCLLLLTSLPFIWKYSAATNKQQSHKKEEGRKKKSDTMIHMKYKTRAFLYCLCFHVKTGGISSVCLSLHVRVFFLSSHRSVGSCQRGSERASGGNGSSACRGLCGSQQV